MSPDRHMHSLEPAETEGWPSDADMNEEFAKDLLGSQLTWFCTDSSVYHRCALFGIRKDMFDLWSERYATAARNGEIKRLLPANLLPTLRHINKTLFNNILVNQFYAFLEKEAPNVVSNIKYLREITDLRFPEEWNPRARTMKRRIIGIEPLGYNHKGTVNTHVTSCTIEMCVLSTIYKVAVIDEIQMINDRQRGWAWTNALVGILADEIHLCGEPSAVPLVKKICESLDEEVEVREYTRLGQLKVSKKSLEGSWKNIRKGDCVITFSRKEIYETKKIIEENTGMRCAVIYGGLPPEARAKQAELFNDPDSEYNVMVASDAVGMGINLNIKRIVFMKLTKWDGESVRTVSVSQTRQIGGRAGRFKSDSKIGVVTSFWDTDIPSLNNLMHSTPQVLDAAGVQPPPDIIELFSHQFPKISFAKLWRMFCDIASVSDNYFLCDFDGQEDIAALIEDLPLSIRQKYRLIYAPIKTKTSLDKMCVRKFAEAIAYKKECKIEHLVNLPSNPPRSREMAALFEQWHNIITSYLWMVTNFSYVFKGEAEALEAKAKCEELLHQGLMSMRGQLKAPDSLQEQPQPNVQAIAQG
ncbi:RNA helicase [Coemansia sp. RSA 1939]|nr:RNA helicase [Coemansia sp. RSA 1939]